MIAAGAGVNLRDINYVATVINNFGCNYIGVCLSCIL